MHIYLHYFARKIRIKMHYFYSKKYTIRRLKTGYKNSDNKWRTYEPCRLFTSETNRQG